MVEQGFTLQLSGCRVCTLNHYTENLYPSQSSFWENVICCMDPCKLQAPRTLFAPHTWWLSPGPLRAALIFGIRSDALNLLGVVVRSLKWFSCVRSYPWASFWVKSGMKGESAKMVGPAGHGDLQLLHLLPEILRENPPTAVHVQTANSAQISCPKRSLSTPLAQ